MSWRAYLAVGLCVVLVGGAIVLVRRNALFPPAPDAPGTPGKPAPSGPAADPAAGASNAKNPLYIGQVSTQNPRQVHTVLTTRQGETTYQALVRYTPQSVPFSDVPGLSDVLQVLGQRNQQLPQFVMRLDQETEMLKDNLGEPLRSVASTHFYMNPVNGQVIGYDVANSAGGQPQRFVGHLTRTGVTVEVFRGGEHVDHHEIPFQGRDTFIPVEVEFIHQWYQSNPGALQKKEPVSFWVFIPDVMLSLMLAARPLGDQVIPVKDKTYECARYEVVTISTQSAEGLYGRQQMWFDKRSGLLMKREDSDPGFGPGEAPVTERGSLASLAQMRHLAIRAPALPDKFFPYQLGQDLVYSVRVTEKELGSLRVKFARAPGADEEYLATATVNLDAGSGSRHENAVTRFDHNWQPLSYLVSGDEAADAKASYRIDAKLGRGAIEINMQRQVEEPAAPTGGRDSQSREKPQPAPAESATADADGWKDPLRRVPVTDEEAKAQEAAVKPRLNAQKLSRALTPGTYLFDFNRVEHLATLAYRFPLPAPAPVGRPSGSPGGKEDAKPPVVYQKAALFAVRQNLCGVVMFEIKPEPQPALTERQRRRQAANPREDPQLYLVTANNPMLPCRMLLGPDGRLLELALKHGSREVVYTLDDPIMRRRAERAKHKKLDDGPQLIRPPWW